MPNAVRSFGDLNEQAILFDVIKLVIGYIMMFVYTVFMLGRINKVIYLFKFENEEERKQLFLFVIHILLYVLICVRLLYIDDMSRQKTESTF